MFVQNLPPVECYIRKEYLYDFTKGHGELEPCVWISLKSIRDEAFRFESYLSNYGALYDKLPISAFVSKQDVEHDKLLPQDYLQLWDCFDYDIQIIEKRSLLHKSCKFIDKNNTIHHGQYMFTIDTAHMDDNIMDVGLSETQIQHKSYNCLKLNNGQYALQPNNRCLFLLPHLNPDTLLRPDFHVGTQKYVSENSPKWADSNSDTKPQRIE